MMHEIWVNIPKFEKLQKSKTPPIPSMTNKGGGEHVSSFQIITELHPCPGKKWKITSGMEEKTLNTRNKY